MIIQADMSNDKKKSAFKAICKDEQLHKIINSVEVKKEKFTRRLLIWFLKARLYSVCELFGQFYDGNKMIQYSYDKLDGVKYSSNSEYSVYLVTLPRVDKTKYIEADGVKVSVPYNAEEILASIYNEDWRVPNPNWKSNSGKCSTLLNGKVGHQVIN